MGTETRYLYGIGVSDGRSLLKDVLPSIGPVEDIGEKLGYSLSAQKRRGVSPMCPNRMVAKGFRKTTTRLIMECKS